MTSDDNRQKSTLEAAPKSWNRLYESKYLMGLRPSRDNIFYFQLCLIKTYSLLRCSYVLKPFELLQMRDDNFRRSDSIASSLQSQSS